MRLLTLLLLLPCACFAQVSGIVAYQGSLPTKPLVGTSLQSTNIDWDPGTPSDVCQANSTTGGGATASSWNFVTLNSNPYVIHFQVRYNDISINDCNLSHADRNRAEISPNSGAQVYPLSSAATGNYSSTIGIAYNFMIEPVTISSQWNVLGQFHPGSSAPAGASPAVSFEYDACEYEQLPPCGTGPSGGTFHIVLRQTETASLPNPIYAYTNTAFALGKYHGMSLTLVYSQNGCMLSVNGNGVPTGVSTTCYCDGVLQANSTCANPNGSVQVSIDGVQVLNYTGIVLGYPEPSANGCTTTTCAPYWKYGIYRALPASQETEDVIYDSMTFASAQINSANTGMGAWR